MSSLRQVSRLLPSALWQGVTGALWPLHPDLTGMNISYAILFLLIPHPDLSQLLSDLKQEFIDSQKWHNLSTVVPFSCHLVDLEEINTNQHMTNIGECARTVSWKETMFEWVKSPVQAPPCEPGPPSGPNPADSGTPIAAASAGYTAKTK